MCCLKFPMAQTQGLEGMAWMRLVQFGLQTTARLWALAVAASGSAIRVCICGGQWLWTIKW